MFPLPPHNTLRNQCHYAHFTDEKVRTERGPLFPKGPNQARLTLPHVICNLLVYIPISPTIKGWAPLQTEEEIWKSVSPRQQTVQIEDVGRVERLRCLEWAGQECLEVSKTFRKETQTPSPPWRLPQCLYGDKRIKSLSKKAVFLSLEILHPALLLGRKQKRWCRMEAEGKYHDYYLLVLLWEGEFLNVTNIQEICILPQRLVSLSRVFKVFWVSSYMPIGTTWNQKYPVGWARVCCSLMERDLQGSEQVPMSEAARLPVPSHSPWSRWPRPSWHAWGRQGSRWRSAVACTCPWPWGVPNGH